MNRAKFKLDFEVELGYEINREIAIELPHGTRVILCESKGTNRGVIFFYVESPDEDKARDIGQKKLEHFFNCMLISVRELHKIDKIKLIAKPQLLNPEDFNGVIKTGYADYKIMVDIVRSSELLELDTTARLFVAINGLPPNIQEIIVRSLRWFRKASEVDGEDRFIFHWVSFEAILGLLEKKSGTKELINGFINDFLDRETIRSIVEKYKLAIERLSDANLKSWQGNPCSEPLRDSLLNGHDFTAILQRTAICIYQVRNDLFHAGKPTKFLEDYSTLLRDITRECLKSYVYSNFQA